MRRFGLILTAAAALLSPGSAASAQQSENGGPTITLYALDNYDDPAIIRPVRAEASYREWLTPADLPADAFDPARLHYYRIRLVVGADARLTDCQPLEAPAEIAARACAAFRARGRFVHAVDTSGAARGGTLVMGFALQVREAGDWAGLPPAPMMAGWRNTLPVIRDAALLRLPADPQKFTASEPALWADVDAKGRVTRCRIRISTGTDAGDAELCRRMAKARFDPARDPQGNKVAAPGFHVKFAAAP